MKVLAVLLLTLAPRPITDAERQALSSVAAQLERGGTAATWTLRTTDAKDLAALHVRHADGTEERVLLPNAVRTAARAPQRVRSRAPLWGLAAVFLLGAIALIRRRLIAIALFAGAVAFGVIAMLPRREVSPSAPVATRRAEPLRDDMLLEAGDYARMRAMGSRDAEAWYADATYESFRTAWLLEPKPREELVRDADLFALLTNDLRVKSLVSFYAASEPARRSAVLGKQPLRWPAGAKAFVCGEHLRVEIGRSAIEVPNGAALAPPDAQLVPATHGERRRLAIALAEAEELLAGRERPTRARLVHGVAALLRHNRWSDIVKLTEGEVPLELLPVRIRALLRANRVDDARALAESQRAEDATATLAIAEAMSNAGQWSTAETLFRSVPGSEHAPLVELRLRQLELRRALATNAQTIATPHFDLRHDATINPAIASRIGDLLEAELARLQTRLPKLELRRVTVNVLRWEDFRRDITRSDHILGMYDGEILFPFAAVQQFKPEVVAVITHELAHAILAQATNDNAPRWFQEGVATRMELLPRHENVFRGTPPALVLPVTLLDAVMEKHADPSAYLVAQTFIRFLEDRYGSGVIATLATEFARGTNSDDALVKLTGKSLDALNAEFRQWGFHHNGDFTLTEPWPYGAWYSPDIDPRVKAGFRFGVRQR